MTWEELIESEYGDGAKNFHVTKAGDTLNVTLTYPPWTDADNKHSQCRHIYVNQEAVRASDGIRLHYDYDRDGFVVEQAKSRLIALGGNSYDTAEDWAEVGFFQSWARNDWPDCQPTEAEYERADAELAAKQTV